MLALSKTVLDRIVEPLVTVVRIDDDTEAQGGAGYLAVVVIVQLSPSCGRDAVRPPQDQGDSFDPNAGG